MALPNLHDGYVVTDVEWNANVTAINQATQKNLDQDDSISGIQSAHSGLEARVTTAEGNISSNDSDISGHDGNLTDLNGIVGYPNYSSVTSLDTRVSSLESTPVALPRFSAYRTTAMGVASASWADLTFDTVSMDSDSAYSTSTGVWTCPATGDYVVTSSCAWDGAVAGFRGMKVLLNSASLPGATDNRGAGDASHPVTCSPNVLTPLTQGDTISVQVFCSESGGSVTADYPQYYARLNIWCIATS